MSQKEKKDEESSNMPSAAVVCAWNGRTRSISGSMFNVLRTYSYVRYGSQPASQLLRRLDYDIQIFWFKLLLLP